MTKLGFEPRQFSFKSVEKDIHISYYIHSILKAFFPWVLHRIAPPSLIFHTFLNPKSSTYFQTGTGWNQINILNRSINKYLFRKYHMSRKSKTWLCPQTILNLIRWKKINTHQKNKIMYCWCWFIGYLGLKVFYCLSRPSLQVQVAQ